MTNSWRVLRRRQCDDWMPLFESRKFDMGHVGAVAAEKKDLYFVQSMISGYGWWFM